MRDRAACSPGQRAVDSCGTHASARASPGHSSRQADPGGVSGCGPISASFGPDDDQAGHRLGCATEDSDVSRRSASSTTLRNTAESSCYGQIPRGFSMKADIVSLAGTRELAAANPEVRTSGIAYVLKAYARTSETFITNEIHLLETLGLELKIFSIKKLEKQKHHATLATITAPVTYLPQ